METPPLPLEIILLILQSLRPRNQDALLSPEDDTTKTLLSLTRVSKALYWPATELLRQHCAYIDTRQRAKAFTSCLQLSPPPFLKQQTTPKDGWKGMQRLFVACYPDNDGFVPSQEDIPPELIARVSGLQDVVGQEFIGNPVMYSPVSDVSSPEPPDPSPLDDLATTMALYDIFRATAPTLKRLVIDMPLRTLWPEHDTKGIKKVLWRGLEVLGNLEEFTSVRDELFLYSPMERWWRFDVWPKLRRLCVYNPDLGYDVRAWGFSSSLQEQQCFELLVCSRTDDLLKGVEIWRQVYGDMNPEPGAASKTLTLVHIDVEGVDPVPWLEFNSLEGLRFINKTLPVPQGPAFGDDPSTWPLAPMEIVQEWLLDQSLNGTLWEQALIK